MNKRGRVARTPIELAAVGGLTRGKDPTGSGGYRMIILQIIGGSLEERKKVCIFAATLITYNVYVELWKKDYRMYI